MLCQSTGKCKHLETAQESPSKIVLVCTNKYKNIQIRIEILLKKETNLRTCPAKTLEQYYNHKKKKLKIVRQQ